MNDSSPGCALCKSMFIVIAGIAIVGLLIYGVIASRDQFALPETLPLPRVTPSSVFVTAGGRDDLIRLWHPVEEEIIGSPLIVEGEARGYWYFEASFPVRLFDGNGNELAVKPAQAQDEWMTEEFVPFRVLLEFEMPSTDVGTLVLEKDNPSGLPEHADELRIPVRFR